MSEISEKAVELLRAKGRRAKRSRHQNGWVEETGIKVKKWKGHYYTYEIGRDGEERRVHRSKVLGLKSKLKKGEAEAALREIIDREVNGKVSRPADAITVEWFARERFFPLRREHWKGTHAARTEYIIRRYVVAPFAGLPITEVNRFDLQKHVNALAKKASRSVVKKFVTWSRALFDEAVEQDFLLKNPARSLIVPETRAETRRSLSLEEVAGLLDVMEGRDRLILRMYLVLGLRARELFALRRDDVAGDRLRVDETVDEKGNFYKPKTSASKAWLWIPPALAKSLEEYLATMRDDGAKALLFSTSSGRPIEAGNWRARALKSAADSLGIKGITIHALRRTCATQMNEHGGVKDVQAHLRHSRPEITAEVYIQEIPANVRAAVEALEKSLEGEKKRGEESKG